MSAADRHATHAGSPDYQAWIQRHERCSAAQIAESLRQRVEQFGFEWRGERLNVTVSLGLVPFRGGEAASDPAGKLSAWLLSQTNLVGER